MTKAQPVNFATDSEQSLRKRKRLENLQAGNLGQIITFLIIGLIVITNLRLIVITSQLNDQLRIITTHIDGVLGAAPQTDIATGAVVEVSLSGAATQGPTDAPIQIVEFADFQCPYCASARSVLDRVFEEYEGQVLFVSRHFPLPSHPQAMLAAEAAECAREQGYFWEMRDLLYDNQTQLGSDLYQSLAEQLGLDVELFDLCLSEHRYREAIEADFEAGQAYGVRGTPTFFINGRYVPSASFEVFQGVIEGELASAQP